MKPIESYSLDDPIFLTQEDPETAELGEWLESDGVFLGVYVQNYDSSTPSEDFLEAYVEHFEEDEEVSEADVVERQKRIEEIRAGSPLTADEISFHDSWSEENDGLNPITACPTFYEEAEHSGRFWVAVVSYYDPAELVTGPYPSLESACKVTWDRIVSPEFLNWTFFDDIGHGLPMPPQT